MVRPRRWCIPGKLLRTCLFLNVVGQHGCELSLIRIPEMRPPLYSGHFKKSTPLIRTLLLAQGVHCMIHAKVKLLAVSIISGRSPCLPGSTFSLLPFWGQGEKRAWYPLFAHANQDIHLDISATRSS